MTALWIVLAVLALPLLGLLDVYVNPFRAGLRFTGTPDGKPWRLRKGHWLPVLLGSTGVTVGRTTHLKRKAAYSTPFLAHEFHHAAIGYSLPRYLFDATYRHGVEAEAIQWGKDHANDPFFAAVARIIGG